MDDENESTSALAFLYNALASRTECRTTRLPRLPINPFGHLDDDALGTAKEAEPEDVLVVVDGSHRVEALGPQFFEKAIQVIDDEGEVADAESVR